MVSVLKSIVCQKMYIDYNSKLVNNLPARYSSSRDYNQLKGDALNIATGRIARYDTENLFGEKDGKMSFDEYLKEQRYNLKANTGNDSLSKQEMQMMKEDFNSLDINSDGFLSDIELANEILTMDSLGNKDGIITMNEYGALWDGEKNTSKAIKQMLTDNFKKYFFFIINLYD